MASYCKQCSIEIFGSDFEEHKGIISEEDSKNGIVARVICEGCGVTQVDHLGVCQGGCLKKSHERQE